LLLLLLLFRCTGLLLLLLLLLVACLYNTLAVLFWANICGWSADYCQLSNISFCYGFIRAFMAILINFKVYQFQKLLQVVAFVVVALC